MIEICHLFTDSRSMPLQVRMPDQRHTDHGEGFGRSAKATLRVFAAKAPAPLEPSVVPLHVCVLECRMLAICSPTMLQSNSSQSNNCFTAALSHKNDLNNHIIPMLECNIDPPLVPLTSLTNHDCAAPIRCYKYHTSSAVGF